MVSPAESGTSVLSAATGGKKASAYGTSGRTGPSGTGAAKRQDPGFRSMTCQADQEASAFRIQPGDEGASAFGSPRSEEEASASDPPSGEPFRASALAGSPRGNRKRPSGPGRTPETKVRAPARPGFEKAQRGRLASQAW
jgi:hypothetical protein